MNNIVKKLIAAREDLRKARCRQSTNLNTDCPVEFAAYRRAAKEYTNLVGK